MSFNLNANTFVLILTRHVPLKRGDHTGVTARYIIQIPNRYLSARTVRKRRLKSAGLKSRIVIKRPMLSDRHQRLRFAWCLSQRDLNLRTWSKIHWSDENRLLPHVTDGRMRVWRQKHTAYIPRNIQPRNIQPTVPYGGGSVMILGCISHDCKRT